MIEEISTFDAFLNIFTYQKDKVIESLTDLLLIDFDTFENFLQSFVDVLVSETSQISIASIKYNNKSIQSTNNRQALSERSVEFHYDDANFGTLVIGYPVAQSEVEHSDSVKFLNFAKNLCIAKFQLMTTIKKLEDVTQKFNYLLEAGNSPKGLSANCVYQKILNSLSLFTPHSFVLLLIKEDHFLKLNSWNGNLNFDEKKGLQINLYDSTILSEVHSNKNCDFIKFSEQKVDDLGLGELRKAAISRIEGLLILPIFSDEDFLGSLIFGYESEDQYDPSSLDILLSIANQIAITTNLAKKTEEKAVKETKDRFLFKLHDSVLQTLYTATLFTEDVDGSIGGNVSSGVSQNDKLKALIEEALIEAKMLQYELRPEELSRERMINLVKNVCSMYESQTRMTFEVKVEGDLDLQPEVKEYFYYILREALNNVKKHSGADQVKVVLINAPESLYMKIVDNGCGFDPKENKKQNLGLQLMKEWANHIRADFSIKSRVGGPTNITVLRKRATVYDKQY